MQVQPGELRNAESLVYLLTCAMGHDRLPTQAFYVEHNVNLLTLNKAAAVCVDTPGICPWLRKNGIPINIDAYVPPTLVNAAGGDLWWFMCDFGWAFWSGAAL